MMNLNIWVSLSKAGLIFHAWPCLTHDIKYFILIKFPSEGWGFGFWVLGFGIVGAEDCFTRIQQRYRIQILPRTSMAGVSAGIPKVTLRAF